MILFACREKIKRRSKLSPYEKREAKKQSQASQSNKEGARGIETPNVNRRAPKRQATSTAKAGAASTSKRQKEDKADKKAEKGRKKAEKKADNKAEKAPQTQGYQANPEGGRGKFEHGYAKHADKALFSQVVAMEERMGLMQIEKDALLKAKDKLVESCNDLKIKLVQKEAEIKAQKELNGLAPKADTIKPGHIQIATADLEMFKEGAAVLKHLRGEHEELKRKYMEVSASSTSKFQEGMDAAYRAMKIARGLTTPPIKQ